MSKNDPAERTVRDIRRKTRKQYTAEEKIRIVVSGLRGEESIAELCRREGIAESLYYSWSKEFLPPRRGIATCYLDGAVTVTGWCQLRVASSFLL